MTVFFVLWLVTIWNIFIVFEIIYRSYRFTSIQTGVRTIFSSVCLKHSEYLDEVEAIYESGGVLKQLFIFEIYKDVIVTIVNVQAINDSIMKTKLKTTLLTKETQMRLLSVRTIKWAMLKSTKIRSKLKVNWLAQT